MLELIRSFIAALLRAAFTLVGVALATGLVVFGLLMAGGLALFARLTGRPILFQRFRMREGVRPPFGAPPSGWARAPQGEVIDAEVREVHDAPPSIEPPPGPR